MLPKPSPTQSPSSDKPASPAAGAVSRRLTAWRRVARRFARQRRSAVSLELAIIGVPFFVLFLGTMEVAYDVYVQSALNYAVTATARKIYDGTIQYSGGAGDTAFVSTYMCPNISGMLDCSLIHVNIANIQETNTTTDWWLSAAPAYVTGIGPSFTLATSSWSICTGGPGTPMLFQAVYAGPSFVGGLIHGFIVSYKGAYIHPTYSSVAWVNASGNSVTLTC